MITNNSIQKHIHQLIKAIPAYDKLEELHIRETSLWIKRGSPLFRLQKPDIPSKHLVSYFVVLDENQQRILLVDHKKALLWLPSGGHVEVDEDPKTTVERECLEELGIQADFRFSNPFFLTSTITVGITAGHTDVSLWYVLKGDSRETYEYDTEEFNEVRWFGFDEIPYEKSDPHMKRFIEKLKARL
ncbi:MAG: NUDIX domain-containing protein [Candidatus Paracaedibacteraceae bacterium]|nr:NUDIX domain-containing protein [Candidatus Paracaedibacteraceae bacterium]